MATKKRETEGKEERRESLTGTTPKVTDLKVGMKLYREYKGKRYDFEIVEVEGKRLIRMRGQKGTWASLSSASSAVSGHAERGATTLRDAATGKTLLPVPRYDQMAATPGPRKPASKKFAAKKRAAKASAPPASKVKTRPAIKCTVKGCREVFANTAEASKHVAEAH